MIVYIVRCPNTVFGKIVREFNSMQQAFYWAAVCQRNKVPYQVDFRHEDGPKQHEFIF